MFTLITPDEIERHPLSAMQAAIETLSMCELLFEGGELEAGKSQIIGIHNVISALVGTFETVRDELEKREREEVAMEADGKDAYQRGYKAGRADIEDVMKNVAVKTSASFHYDRGYEAGLEDGQKLTSDKLSRLQHILSAHADKQGAEPDDIGAIHLDDDGAAVASPEPAAAPDGFRPSDGNPRQVAPPLTEPVPDGERCDDGRERKTA